jgi:CRISPR-associated protein (TIGR02710 family)
MLRCLVCLVGGSPAPLVRSLLEPPSPDRVIFVCSPQSAVSIPTIVADSAPLTPPHETVQVRDAQDFTLCIQDMEGALASCVGEWLRSSDRELLVDVTGGTKCMSAALALVARRWNCTFRYVGGDRRTKEGLGVVEDQAERIYQYANPMDELGFAAVEDALALCSRSSFGAAADLLGSASRRSKRDPVAGRLKALAKLVRALSKWDLFDFRGALAELQHIERRPKDLEAVLSRSCVSEIIDSLPAWRQRLQILMTGNQVTVELIEDLLANAQRRCDESRHDDAVARYYRATEAISQCQLSSRHNISNTGRIDSAVLLESMRTECQPRIRKDGTVSFGLQEDYRLLRELGDPLGVRFAELGLDDFRRTPLNARNNSILAHGFSRVSEGTIGALRKSALELAGFIGIREETLPRFPVLQGRDPGFNQDSKETGQVAHREGTRRAEADERPL